MGFSSYGSSRPSIPVVINLIIINALVFLLQQAIQPLTSYLALWHPLTGKFEVYQLITHMFTHAGWMHLLFNMYALWLFGSMLERNWGSVRFIIFYLACGFGAAAAQLLIAPSPVPAVGASGAVMGLLAAFAYTYPNVQFFIIPFPFAIRAKWLVVIYVAIDLFGGLGFARSGIAHFAHLGGLATGFLLMIFWISKRRNRY